MSVFSKFPRTFWVVNFLELLERWAWYGFFMLFANYLTGSADVGGLEFSQSQKGILMGVGTGVLYFLPILTGAIADTYGYRKVLLLSFVIYVTGFLLMPHASSFAEVFAVYLYIAIGAALFKPIISAVVSKVTNAENSSVGFGIFYMMINIGGFFGPMLALLFMGDYKLIFYISAAIMALNFVLLMFYKDPMLEQKPTTQTLGQTWNEIFKDMFGIASDRKFVLFLLILSAFWAMYFQLFFTLPVFITQWVDTAPMYDFFEKYMPFIVEYYSVSKGVMSSEFISTFDALYIIMFQIMVSSLVMKMRPLNSMILGFIVCSIGMALSMTSQNVVFILVAILLFALGEMAGSPKILEYIGNIAPTKKKALYMGYSYIPVFLGSVLGGFISGPVYQDMSDKVVIVERYAIENSIKVADGLSSGEYFDAVATQLGASPIEFTNLLWNTYHPYNIWYIFLFVGFASALLLFIYDKIVNVRK